MPLQSHENSVNYIRHKWRASFVQKNSGWKYVSGTSEKEYISSLESFRIDLITKLTKTYNLLRCIEKVICDVISGKRHNEIQPLNLYYSCHFHIRLKYAVLLKGLANFSFFAHLFIF